MDKYVASVMLFITNACITANLIPYIGTTRSFDPEIILMVAFGTLFLAGWVLIPMLFSVRRYNAGSRIS